MKDTVTLRRSALYMPASNSRALEKIPALASDVVIIDLEDAVAPEAKDDAREKALAALKSCIGIGKEVVVRVNGLDTAWGQADIEAVRAAECSAVLVPKISRGEQIRHYRDMIGTERPLWAMVETAGAMGRLPEIAEAGQGLACLVMGTNDLVKELRARPSVTRSTIVPFLGFAVAAARAAGIEILDGVFNAIDDTDGFSTECRQAVELGFDGKTLIHPSQIAPCNAEFSPTAEDVEWARKILAEFDSPENLSRGAIRVDGKMVERLHLFEARRTVSMAERANSLV